MWDSIIGSALVCGVLITAFGLLTNLIRWQQLKKSQRYFMQLEHQINVGVNVILINGIIGSIVKIENDCIHVLIAPNVTITCVRHCVKMVINK